MALESATYINELVATNPTGTDARSQGDDHIRMVKSAVKITFPNITGAVTPTHTELNYVDGVTSAVQTQLDAKAPLASPTLTGDSTISGTLEVTGVTTLGTTTTPTMTGDDDSTNVATTAFVNGEIYDNKNTADYPVVMDSAGKLPALDGSQLTGITRATNTLFTSSGTFDVPVGITTIYVTASGAGGGGSHTTYTCGGGGGGAGCMKAPVTVTAGQTLTITIGAGGDAGGNNGAAGGDTTVTGTNVSVTLGGGGGGTSNVQPNGGGSGGSTSGVSNALTSGSGGDGGSFQGSGGAAAGVSFLTSNIGSSWGAGGNGYAHPSGAGEAGPGTVGYCLIET